MRVLLLVSVSLLLSRVALALPKDIEIDRLLLSIETSVAAQQWNKANARLIAVKSLDDELPAAFYYYRGQVSMHLNNTQDAKVALEYYLEKEGREGEFYRTSLGFLNQIEDVDTARKTEKVRQSMSRQLVIEDSEHKKYIETLRGLYLVEEGRDALEFHINTLLSNHRYIPGRYRNTNQWLGSLYQIQVRRGEVSILEKRADNTGGYSLNQDLISVYGVNPYLQIQCDAVGDQCWLNHPETGKQWLELEPNRRAVTDVAEAFSHLIRYMQGG
jgi:hypothetical protein